MIRLVDIATHATTLTNSKRYMANITPNMTHGICRAPPTQRGPRTDAKDSAALNRP